MKCKVLTTFATILLFVSTAKAQNSMGVGTTSPNPNAVLQLVSPNNDQGFMLPGMTSAQRTSPAFTANLGDAEKGMLVFDADLNQFFFWDGSAWQEVGLQIVSGQGIEVLADGRINNTGDLDSLNELLDPSLTRLSGTTLELTDAAGTIAIDLSPLQDGTGTDAQDLQLTGTSLTLTNDGTSVDLSGFLDNTDAQDLVLSGNVLSLSNDPTAVDLSSFLDNTDSQSLGLTGTSLSITGGNTVDLSSLQDGVDDADSDPINEIQDLQLSGNILTITNNPSATSVDLAPFSGTNTDNQTLGLTGTDLSITGGNTVNLAVLQDGFEANTDNQDLTLAGTILGIVNGNTVDLSVLQDGTGTDNQDLTLTGNTLSLTNDGTTVDLSGFLDNTDEQNLSILGTQLTIDNGNTVDLAVLQDGIGTDDQTATEVTVTPQNGIASVNVQAALEELQSEIASAGGGDMLRGTYDVNSNNIVDNAEAVSGFTVGTNVPAAADFTDDQTLTFDGASLTIAGGNSVDISTLSDGFEANTDNQNLTLAGTTLGIVNGNTVDLSVLQDGTGTDNQDLTLTGNTLSLTNDGTTVDLSAFLDNTDAQNLSLAGTQLSIDNGNTVDLAVLQDGVGTDDQTAAEVTVTPQNGISSVNVQAALEELQGEIASAGGGDMLTGTYDVNSNNIVDNAEAVSGFTVGTNVPAAADFTDDQTLTFDGASLTIAGGNSVDISTLSDGFEANTDNQNLTLAGTTLGIVNGNTVDLSVLQDGTGTDNQDLSLTGNTLSLTNDGTTVDLSAFLDNTDAQNLSIAGTQLTIDNGNTVDLAVLQDGVGTDNQDLSLTGNTLSLTNDGTTVDLSGFLDNTDAQNLSLAGTQLTIDNGNTVDLAVLQDGFEANTDAQDLTFSAGQISLTGDPDATVIDLSGYDTDASDDLVLGSTQSLSSAVPLIDLTNDDGLAARFARTSGINGTALRVESTQNGGVAEFVKSGDNALPVITIQDQIQGGAAIQANRGIIIGDLGLNTAGGIRWTGTDFEGYDGTTWQSFTGGFSGSWVDLTDIPAPFADGIDNVADADDDPTNELELPAQTGNAGRFLTTDGSTPSWALVPSSPWTISGSDLTYDAGFVGVGTTVPQASVHIVEAVAAVDGSDAAFLDLQNLNGAQGAATGVRFKSNTNVGLNAYKAGIVFERGGPDANQGGFGDIVFAINSDDNLNNFTLADERMRLGVQGLSLTGNLNVQAFSTFGNTAEFSSRIRSNDVLEVNGELDAGATNAGIAGYYLTSNGAGQAPTWSPNLIDFTPGTVDDVFINPSLGNARFGINTNTPSTFLEVQHGNALTPGIEIDATATFNEEASIRFTTVDNQVVVGVDDAGGFSISDGTSLGSTDRLTISSSGITTISGSTTISGNFTASAGSSFNGIANFTQDLRAANGIAHYLDTDTEVLFGADRIDFRAGNVTLMSVIEGTLDYVNFPGDVRAPGIPVLTNPSQTQFRNVRIDQTTGELIEETSAACPFVYVEMEGEFELSGTILEAQAGKYLEGVQSHYLPLPDTSQAYLKVKIKLEEPEISYVDQLLVLITIKDSLGQISVDTLQPKETSVDYQVLRRIDENYHRLEFMDEFELIFDNPAKRKDVDILKSEIVSSGYYDIDFEAYQRPEWQWLKYEKFIRKTMDLDEKGNLVHFRPNHIQNPSDYGYEKPDYLLKVDGPVAIQSNQNAGLLSVADNALVIDSLGKILLNIASKTTGQQEEITRNDVDKIKIVKQEEDLKILLMSIQKTHPELLDEQTKNVDISRLVLLMLDKLSEQQNEIEIYQQEVDLLNQKVASQESFLKRLEMRLSIVEQGQMKSN